MSEAFLLHIKFMTVIVDFCWLHFKDLCSIVIWEFRNVKMNVSSYFGLNEFSKT